MLINDNEKYNVETLKELINILKEDTEEKLDYYIDKNRLFVRSANAKTELMLRYKSDEYFTIAVI